MKTLTAALFAGGESRRMGADKAMLLWDGKPLWQRQLETLRRLASQHLVVSARQVPAWCPPDVEVVLDSPLARGPMAGLIGLLELLRTSHVLVLAVDMPRMTTEHLLKLNSLVSLGHGIIPVGPDSMEPLGAIYPAEAIHDMKTATPGNFSLNRLNDILIKNGLMRTFRLAESEARLYHNINSPADLTV